MYLFRHEACQEGYQWTGKRRIWLNLSKRSFCNVRKFRKGSNLDILLLFGNFIKDGLLTFSLFFYAAFGDDIDQLSRDGFDWIIWKVIFKAGKIRFGLFPHNYQYYSVVTKCSPKVLHYVTCLLWNHSWLKIWNVSNRSKGNFQGQKGPNWALGDLFELISQKR